MAQRVDVVVVGAGMAGLVAAIDLCRAGLDVRLVERADVCGGRVATDVIDGFRLDRGFQVLNTSYPQVQRRLDLGALDVRALTPGALVHYDGRLRRVANPLRAPLAGAASATSGVFGPADLVRLAAYSATAGFGSPARTQKRADVSSKAAFHMAGLSPALIDRFLRPFLAGVLLESELATSRRFVDLVWRSFVRGQSVLPAQGIGRIGDQLAAQLPTGTVLLNAEVYAVGPTTVHTAEETFRARAVVVAADPRSASAWLGQPVPLMRPVVTFYHRAPEPVLGESVIVADGEARGPVVNTVELTPALPDYAPPGCTLVSSSVLDPTVGEQEVRQHLDLLYGTSTRRWELVARVQVTEALPALQPGVPLRRPAGVNGVYVAGDHRATPSLQGAMASGTAVARAVVADLLGRDR